MNEHESKAIETVDAKIKAIFEGAVTPQNAAKWAAIFRPSAESLWKNSKSLQTAKPGTAEQGAAIANHATAMCALYRSTLALARIADHPDYRINSDAIHSLLCANAWESDQVIALFPIASRLQSMAEQMMPIEQTSPAKTLRDGGITCATMRTWLTCNNRTINKYAKLEKLPTPNRGDRDWLWTTEQSRSILESIVRRGNDNALIHAARNALENLQSNRNTAKK